MPSWANRRAVLGDEPWATLDFQEAEESLTAKLTDDDLYEVLTCIDAVNNLKKLCLAGCRNIIGHGLQPLQGSIVLE